jgi:glyoxylate reductase
MKPRVFVTRRLPEPALARLGQVCDFRIGTERGVLSRAALLAGIQEAEGLICLLTDTIDRAVMEAGRQLRVIANVAVGYNNIDVSSAKQRGLIVTNTPDVLTEATADLTWALILAVTRRLVEADQFTRAGKFDGWDFDLLLGAGLTGKTLGVLGFGRIGKAVGRRAVGFGMQVIYCGSDEIAYRDDPAHARLSAPPHSTPKWRSDSFAPRRVGFNQLLQQADIITLHVPLAATTKHLLDAAAFAQMKPGAYLINTARGPVVDETDLTAALQSGHLAGAGLDVYEREPVIQPALLSMSNVVLLPHIGSATLEARTAMAMLAVENTIDVLSGHPARTPV